VPRFVWLDTNNYRLQYVTMLASDPGKPANFTILTSGSDGAPDEALQQYVAGLNSGGFPAYTGDPTQVAVNSRYINGIISGGTGDR
jgi:hypothetical protein